jgi:hypothetical protein
MASGTRCSITIADIGVNGAMAGNANIVTAIMPGVTITVMAAVAVMMMTVRADGDVAGMGVAGMELQQAIPKTGMFHSHPRGRKGAFEPPVRRVRPLSRSGRKIRPAPGRGGELAKKGGRSGVTGISAIRMMP